MKISELKNSNKLFWYIQIPAWSVFTLLTLLLYSDKTFSDWFNLFYHIFEYFIGFTGSVFLRYILRYYSGKKQSILSVSALIIVSSLICGHFWLLASNYFWLVFKEGIFSFDYIFSMNLSGYAFRVFWITLIYCGWGALYFFIKTWLDLQNQTEKTLAAEAMVKESQLQMLRYQLNPHFLFNSLNSISVLIDEEKDKAKEMVADLSEFLRYTLLSKNYSDVPLIKEINAIKRYLDIEKKRYEKKLQIKYEIEERAQEFAIPSFLIHPLVENAVKYGMMTSPMPLYIKIKAFSLESGLRIEITNSGKWMEHSQFNSIKNSTGTGLENIKKRLDNAYPDNHKFEIIKSSGEVTAVIEIRNKGNNT